MCTSCCFSLYVSGRNCITNTGSIVDRPLLNTKWMLPNSTTVRSTWFIIRSTSFMVWGIIFILQKLLHSSMISFPLNSGVSSLNLHEHGMADVSTAYIFFSRHTIPCSLIFFHTSIGIRSDHMSYSTASYPSAFWSPLRISEVLLLQFFVQTAVVLSFSLIQHFWVIFTPSFLDITILGHRIECVVIQIYVVCYVLGSPLPSMLQVCKLCYPFWGCCHGQTRTYKCLH